MVFDWFDIVVLMGILQGWLVALVMMITMKRLSVQKKLLAALLLVFALLSCKISLHTLGLWNTAAFRYFPLAIDLLIQPVIYFYILSLLNPAFVFRRKDWLHFVPAMLFMIHAIAVYLIVLPVSLSEKDQLAEQWLYNDIKKTEDWLSVASAILYGVAGYRVILQYRFWLFRNISDTRYAHFTWLRNLAILAAIPGICLLVNIVLDQFFHFQVSHFFHWQFFYVYISFLIYYLSFRSFRQEQSQVSSIPVQAATVPVSRYNNDELVTTHTAVQQALENDRLFLDTELTLQKLAAHTGISGALLSEAINRKTGKTFRSLINDYRVEEMKARLTKADLDRLSILGIAYECGFNSEASFYRIFKSSTGMSPLAYLEKKQKENPDLK